MGPSTLGVSRAGDDDGQMEVDRNGLEVLDRAECLQLLALRRFGRLGLTSGALPTILPVNYWFDGSSIYVRTSPGSKLDAALRGAVVAFEVDDIEPMEHAGWGVVVTGIAREVTERADQLVGQPVREILAFRIRAQVVEGEDGQRSGRGGPVCREAGSRGPR